MTAARQEPVRYGDLLAMASASLAQARTELYRSPLGTPAQAGATVSGHQDLLAALASSSGGCTGRNSASTTACTEPRTGETARP